MTRQEATEFLKSLREEMESGLLIEESELLKQAKWGTDNQCIIALELITWTWAEDDELVIRFLEHPNAASAVILLANAREKEILDIPDSVFHELIVGVVTEFSK